MADAHNDRQRPEQYEETVHPRNPPNSVINPRARGAALRSYLLPLVAFFIVAGLGLLYWANRGPVTADDPAEVGTSGQGTVGERGNADDTPGGFDPAGRRDSTNEEIEFRGGSQDSRGPMPGLTTDAPLGDLRAMLAADSRNVLGRRIDVQDVEVVEARDAGSFWVRDGDSRVAVSAPEGSPAVRAGAKVDVSGVVEPDGQGGVRIRASRVSED
jgi:hypothetical protein